MIYKHTHTQVTCLDTLTTAAMVSVPPEQHIVWFSIEHKIHFYTAEVVQNLFT